MAVVSSFVLVLLLLASGFLSDCAVMAGLFLLLRTIRAANIATATSSVTQRNELHIFVEKELFSFCFKGRKVDYFLQILFCFGLTLKLGET